MSKFIWIDEREVLDIESIRKINIIVVNDKFCVRFISKDIECAGNEYETLIEAKDYVSGLIGDKAEGESSYEPKSVYIKPYEEKPEGVTFTWEQIAEERHQVLEMWSDSCKSERQKNSILNYKLEQINILNELIKTDKVLCCHNTIEDILNFSDEEVLEKIKEEEPS